VAQLVANPKLRPPVFDGSPSKAITRFDPDRGCPNPSMSEMAMLQQLFLNGRLGQRVCVYREPFIRPKFLGLHIPFVASLRRIEQPHSASMLQFWVMTGD
jgi:hypothetical protein